tara:strand:+ start:573 stop:902 length:330 start_codon:yes stop_codon:yes gene_type:complete
MATKNFNGGLQIRNKISNSSRKIRHKISKSDLASLLLFAGSIVLIVSGGLDLTVSSRDNQNSSYFGEKSSSVIIVRSQGGFKIGHGLGMLAASFVVGKPGGIKELVSKQ